MMSSPTAVTKRMALEKPSFFPSQMPRYSLFSPGRGRPRKINLKRKLVDRFPDIPAAINKPDLSSLNKRDPKSGLWLNGPKGGKKKKIRNHNMHRRKMVLKEVAPSLWVTAQKRKGVREYV